MSTSRLFNLLGSSIIRINHATHGFLSSFPPLRSVQPFPSSSLRFHRCCSSAAVLQENATTYSPESPSSPNYHPWKEWVAFVDNLKVKGYVSEGVAGAEEKAETAGGDDGVVYTDMRLLKDACLQFARDRYDIINSLCQQEMQTLVGKGCPNLLRKAVNSAKRLRAYLGLDEGHVCSACVLRGSCDRANVKVNESDAARTVDVVRILMLYALDPLVTNGGTKHEDRELVEISARNLLVELTELSETVPAPDAPEPVVKLATKKKSFSFIRDGKTSDVEMKRGDWVCSKCKFMNFARNAKCRECGEDGPTTISAGDVEMKKGDWVCPQCSFMNFARNVRCLKCRTKGPERVPGGEVVMKKGDWNCEKCGFMNFASNLRCLRCQEGRAKRHLKPGDWECPACNFLNFRGNISCKKCNHESPKEVHTQYEDMEWKKPF